MAEKYLTLRPSQNYVSHKWRTNIQTTLDGAERRRALYSWPRIGISVEIPNNINKAQAWVRSAFFNHIDDIWGIPMWSDMTDIISTASGSTIPCDTTNRHFYVGRECLVINKSIPEWEDYEVHTITAVEDASITISGTLAKSWTVNHHVVPLYDCRIDDFKANIKRRIRSYDKINLDATEAYDTERSFDYSLPASGTVTYRDRELFIYTPVSPKDETWSRPSTLQQYLGIGQKHTYRSESSRKHNHKFLLGSKSEIGDVLDFFDRHRGRYASFWFPTWNKDIIVTAAIDATDSIITIQDIEYDTEWFINDTIGRHLFIRFPDKSYVCRKISNATSTTIILDSAIGTSVAAGNLSKMYISFLELGRFDIDQMEMKPVQARNTIAYTTLHFVGFVAENG